MYRKIWTTLLEIYREMELSEHFQSFLYDILYPFKMIKGIITLYTILRRRRNVKNGVCENSLCG